VEVLENLVFLSNATNFVAYFTKTMHYTISESANMVTNFIGTSFLLTIFGGFIGDSFFTRFRTFVVFCIIELLVCSPVTLIFFLISYMQATRLCLSNSWTI
jgi:peptide/histidine transporter 3/4